MYVMTRETEGGTTAEYCEVNDVILSCGYLGSYYSLSTHCTDHKYPNTIFMFAPCINSIKTLFIIPTDAHNYIIIGMLKTIKIPTIVSTCFGSRRNYHQGDISCLAKATILPSSTVYRTLAQQAGMPP